MGTLVLTDGGVETLANALRIARDACADDVRTLRAHAARLAAQGQSDGGVSVSAAEASQASARAYGALLDRLDAAERITYAA